MLSEDEILSVLNALESDIKKISSMKKQILDLRSAKETEIKLIDHALDVINGWESENAQTNNMLQNMRPKAHL